MINPGITGLPEGANPLTKSQAFQKQRKIFLKF